MKAFFTWLHLALAMSMFICVGGMIDQREYFFAFEAFIFGLIQLTNFITRLKP